MAKTLFHSRLAWLVIIIGVLQIIGCGYDLGESETGREYVDKGWYCYRLADYDKGVAFFEAAATATDDQIKLNALYGLATLWNLRSPGSDQDKAQRYYRQIIEASPKHDLAVWSRLALVRMKHLVPPGQSPDHDEVSRAYQQIIDDFGEHLAGQEASIYQQAILILKFEKEPARKAIDNLEEFIQKHPDSNYVSTAYGLMSTAYGFILDDPEKQLQCAVRGLETQTVDAQSPFFENAGTYWATATLAEFKVGDFTTARKYYRKLIDEYPVDARVFPCRNALERMDAMETKLRREISDKAGS